MTIMLNRIFVNLFSICLLFLPVKAFSQMEKDLREGDVLFLDLDCGELCDAIEAVTEGVNGQDFSHLGLISFQNDSAFVLEAIGNSVRLTPLATFLAYSSKPALVARLRPEFQQLIPKAMQFGKAQTGVPYDDAFLSENGKFYCSELIYEAFKTANNGKPFFKLEPMTFRKPGQTDFFPVWIEYYQKLGIPVPEGKPGCNPGGLSRSDKLRISGILSSTK